MIYILVMTFALFMGVFANLSCFGYEGHIVKDSKKRFVVLFMGAIPLFLTSALRFGLGTDYFYTYTPQFEIIKGGGESYYERGFYYFNRVLSYFTSDFHWLFVVTSAVFVFGTFYCIYRYSYNAFFSVFIFLFSYVFFISMNNVRQSMASVFLFFALHALINKKKILFIFLVLVAGSIHQVSFVFIALLLFDLFEADISVLGSILVGVFAVSKFLGGYIIKIAMLIPRLALYFRDNELEGYLDKSISKTFLLLNICILLLYYYIEKNCDVKNDREWNIAVWIQFLILAICALDGIVPAVYRIVRIFSFMNIFMVPLAISKIKTYYNKMIVYFAVAFAYLVDFMGKALQNTEEVFPYVSIFS